MTCHEVVVARTQSTSAFCPENTSIGSEKNAPHQTSCERRKGPCEALSVAWRVDLLRGSCVYHIRMPFLEHLFVSQRGVLMDTFQNWRISSYLFVSWGAFHQPKIGDRDHILVLLVMNRFQHINIIIMYIYIYIIETMYFGFPLSLTAHLFGIII